MATSDLRREPPHAEGRSAWRPAPLLAGSLAWQLAGAAAWAFEPQHWRPILAALLADHVLLTAAGFVPRCNWLGPNQDRLPMECRARREVALTFDDGPDPAVTPRVLELLAQAGVRASFFCIGQHAAHHPDLLSEIARQGHRIENHSYSHSVLFSMLPPAALRRELERTQEVLATAAGRVPELFRAPAGFRSLLLDPVLHRLGLRFVSWTRRGFDKADGNAERVAQRVAGTASPGDVLLLHDGAPARDRTGRPVVLEALPRVLDVLAERNLKPVPLTPGGAAG